MRLIIVGPLFPRERRTTGPFLTEHYLMVRTTLLEVPPPGAGFFTAIVAVPADPIAALVTWHTGSTECCFSFNECLRLLSGVRHQKGRCSLNRLLSLAETLNDFESISGEHNECCRNPSFRHPNLAIFRL